MDVWLLLLPLALAACWGKRVLFWTTLPIWALFLALRLLRIGDTVVPMYLNRPFNLYLDSAYLYGLYDLLKTSSRQGDFLLLAAGAAIVTLGVCALSWFAWQWAAWALTDRRLRLAFLGASALLLGAFLIRGVQPAKPPALVRLGQEIRSVHRQREQQQAFSRPTGAPRPGAVGRSCHAQRSGRGGCPAVFYRILWSRRLQPASLPAGDGVDHG